LVIDLKTDEFGVNLAESLRVLHERGFQGKAAHISEMIGETFDLIFMFQVLEHMDDLDGIFSRLSVLLRQGGSLYLAVPNLSRTNFQEHNHTLLDMPPNHISRWAKSSFEAILKRHDLRLKEFEVEAGSFLSFCLQDLKYFTLRQSMYPNTLASKAYDARQSVKRKFALACVATIYLFRRLPLWLRTAGSIGELGGSVWLKVRRR
jgi:SAM-dependent methyltransferase